MGQFSHPNVVKLYGVVTVGKPVSKNNICVALAIIMAVSLLQIMICIELMSQGDLNGYLCSLAPDLELVWFSTTNSFISFTFMPILVVKKMLWKRRGYF